MPRGGLLARFFQGTRSAISVRAAHEGTARCWMVNGGTPLLDSLRQGVTPSALHRWRMVRQQARGLTF